MTTDHVTTDQAKTTGVVRRTPHVTLRRLAAGGAVAVGLTAGLMGTAPAAQAWDGYANCNFGAKFPGSEQRWAMCNADAPGTDFRVVVRCTTGPVMKGEWVRQGIGEKSWTLCITGGVTDVWREVR